nr:hypothetical protein [Bradyrhizobium sp. 195]
MTDEVESVLCIIARSMEGYEKFTHRSFNANSDIKTTTTMVIVDRVKVGFAVPIETPSED